MSAWEPPINHGLTGMPGLESIRLNAVPSLRNLYHALRFRATVARLASRVTGHRRGLLDLRTLLEHNALYCCSYDGLRAVPMERILGTESRYWDFDREFLPLTDHTEQRWLRVARARSLGIALPPVDLIQVGEVYYVRDGHHRISVARAMGETSIDAEVTRYELAPRVLHLEGTELAAPIRWAGPATAEAHAEPSVAVSVAHASSTG